MAYVETYMERNLKLLEKPLRLGLLLPSSNTAMEEELAQMIPGNDVTVHASRVRLSDVTPEALVEMENNSEEGGPRAGGCRRRHHRIHMFVEDWLRT